MIRLPLPFVVTKYRPKKLSIHAEQRSRRTRMTLVAALRAHDGVALFADNEEVVGGYSRKNVDKLRVYEPPNCPFRFAIAGAADDATYLDTLQAHMANVLAEITNYDVAAIALALSEALRAFYSQHIWPKTTHPKMEYLIVLQALPNGIPQILRVSESAVTVDASRHPSIGIGAYLADYLFQNLIAGIESIIQMVTLSVYVAGQVRENISGCGQVERIALFSEEWGYDELKTEDIHLIEGRLRRMNEATYSTFSLATGWADPIAEYEDTAFHVAKKVRADLAEWHQEWDSRRSQRKRYLDHFLRRKSAS